MNDTVSVCKIIDQALTSLAAAQVQASEADTVLDIRMVRGALAYYRWERCLDDQVPYGRLPDGSLTTLTRKAEEAVETLLEGPGNTPVQLAVLRSCLQRVRAIIERRRMVVAAWGDYRDIGQSVPMGDRV